jgi:WD40 repeat protein
MAADNIVFNPSGTRVALGNRSTLSPDLTLLDPNSGKTVLLLQGHRTGLLDAAFSPDGRHVVTTSFDNTLRAWDASTGRLLYSAYEPAYIPRIAFSPDGQRLATAMSTGSLSILGTVDYRELYNLQKHNRWINAIAYSPDGAWLASASSDAVVKVWDASGTQEWLAIDLPPASGVSSASLDSLYDMDVSLSPVQEEYQVVAAALRHVQPVPGVTQDIYGVYLSDFATGSLLRKWELNQPTLQVALSPDGARLATASFDGTARIWETHLDPSYRPLAALSSRVPLTGIAFYPDGERVVMSDCQGTVTGWNWVTSEVIFEVATVHEPEMCEFYDAVAPVMVSANGNMLAALGHDHRVRLLNAHTGELLRLLEDESGGDIYGIALSADGRYLATGSSDSIIVVWALDQARPVQILTGHGRPFTSLAFSPDGELLASGGSLTTLWDWRRGLEKFTLARPEGGVVAVAFSPDGRHLSIGGAGSTIQVYLTQLEDLVGLARFRLTRNLTEVECQRYLRLERCPPLPQPRSH